MCIFTGLSLGFSCSRFGLLLPLYCFLLRLLDLYGHQSPLLMSRLSARQSRDHRYLLLCCALVMYFVCSAWPNSLPTTTTRTPPSPISVTPHVLRTHKLHCNPKMHTMRIHCHPRPTIITFHVVAVLTYFVVCYILRLRACFVCLLACFGVFPIYACPNPNPEHTCSRSNAFPDYQ